MFPMAVMANTFAMTALMIALGLTGKSVLAAEIGMAHGATTALFFAFSANARSLILNQSSSVSADSIMLARLGLAVPLSCISYWLSAGVSGMESSLAIVLILRRCAEWLGEVYLSELERQQECNKARTYFFSQILLLALVFFWLILDIKSSYIGLWLWAVVPILFLQRSIKNAFSKILIDTAGLSASLLPHLGSTAIIGITVYVFRLIIVLLIGKDIAGDLFTAFAIGGLIGSVFANVLGASMALHQQRTGKYHFPLILQWPLKVSFILGMLLTTAAALNLPYLDITGKSNLFWLATGLSLIGGVIMVFAQKSRFKLLHHDAEHDVFGPDVMINILLVAAIPFCFYLLGLQALAGLYLLSAILGCLFYSFHETSEKKFMKKLSFTREKLQFFLSFILLFPLFFQANGNIFHDPALRFESNGSISRLPIPWSVLACYGGILVLGAYKRAFMSLSVIFFTFILMLTASIFVTGGEGELAQAKLILMMQFILPMFALVLGQQFDAPGFTQNAFPLEKAFLCTLIVIVPAQLIHSWTNGLLFLSPDLYFFSIYQHLQYVPVLFCGAFLIALYSLWHIKKWKIMLVAISPIMGVYAAASLSMLAIAFLIAGAMAFAAFNVKSNNGRLPAITFLVISISLISYLYFEKSAVTFKFGSNQDATLTNINDRFYFWKYYFNEATNSVGEFLFGHEKLADRSKYPSAHNYYLDFIYNFGALALLPLLILTWNTFSIIYNNRGKVLHSSSLLGLSGVALFLVFVDNSLKVGLRQPYPGILSFFLWGLLISRLADAPEPDKDPKSV